MVYIVDAKRTPIGAFMGQFSSYQGWQLGVEVIKHLAPLVPETGYFGCVLGAGQGQAPARQAVMHAYQNPAIDAVTVNKVCGSGMFSVMMACDQILIGRKHVVVAGGFESMTQSPFLLSKGRQGYRVGHDQLYDHMMLDGLEDAYSRLPNGSRAPMGLLSEKIAEAYGFSRSDQETFAAQTFDAYQKAEQTQVFQSERITIQYTDRRGQVCDISTDEPPLHVKPEKFSALKPAFMKDGTITAATSSSLADGAAAVLLTSESGLSHYTPLGRIVGYTSFSHEPEWFTTAPIHAMTHLLSDIKWSLNDVDLFEINEAFAVVPLAAMKTLGIPREKVNIHGGACTLGHPIGASGARIIVTLLYALRTHGLKKGIAVACIGGGEATAIAVEIVS